MEVEANSIECLSAKKTPATKETSSDANIAKVELENVLGSIEEKGTNETYGDVAIEKSALELQGVDASEELSIKDVEMPKKRGRKKKADTFPG